MHWSRGALERVLRFSCAEMLSPLSFAAILPVSCQHCIHLIVDCDSPRTVRPPRAAAHPFRPLQAHARASPENMAENMACLDIALK